MGMQQLLGDGGCLVLFSFPHKPDEKGREARLILSKWLLPHGKQATVPHFPKTCRLLLASPLHQRLTFGGDPIPTTPLMHHTSTRTSPRRTSSQSQQPFPGHGRPNSIKAASFSSCQTRMAPTAGLKPESKSSTANQCSES